MAKRVFGQVTWWVAGWVGVAENAAQIAIVDVVVRDIQLTHAALATVYLFVVVCRYAR